MSSTETSWLDALIGRVAGEVLDGDGWAERVRGLAATVDAEALAGLADTLAIRRLREECLPLAPSWPDEIRAQVVDAIEQVIDALESGDADTRASAERSAESAAQSAGSGWAAWSAEQSAWSAWSAEQSAWSAWSAAWSASWSASSAAGPAVGSASSARSAAWQREAERIESELVHDAR